MGLFEVEQADEMIKNQDKQLQKQRSKALIHDAFIQILAEKPLERITVKEIAEVANINRKTFYAHYSNVDEIAQEISEELVSSIEAFMQTCMIDDYGLSPQYFMQFLNIIYSSNSQFFEHLVREENYMFLVLRCKEALKQQMLSGLDPSEEQYIRVSYRIEFCLGGAFSLFVEWFKDGKPVPFETVSEIVISLILEGVSG